jgi:hypothetical protein
MLHGRLTRNELAEVGEFGRITLALSDAPFVAMPTDAADVVRVQRPELRADEHVDLRHGVGGQPLNDVMKGSVTGTAASPAGCGVLSRRFQEGSRLVALSRTPRPVLVPPWNVRPLLNTRVQRHVHAVPVLRTLRSEIGLERAIGLRANAARREYTVTG